MAIFVLTTTTTRPITLPLAHARGVKIFEYSLQILHNWSSLEHKTLGALHGISYMLQQFHAEKGVAKGLPWGRGETGMRLMLYLHSSDNYSRFNRS